MKNKVLLVVLCLSAVACGRRASFTSAGGTCTVSDNKIVCPDGSSLELPAPEPGKDGRDGSDGQDGEDGADGKDGLNGTIVTIVDPCGDDPGHVDEVVMVFSDGTILAWYLNIGFSVLEPGVVYRTTDHQKCKFTVNGGKVEDQ